MTGPSPIVADAFLSAMAAEVVKGLRGELRYLLAPASDDVITGIQEIADYLHISYALAQRELGTSIPARQVGSKWVASRVALTEWMRSS